MPLLQEIIDYIETHPDIEKEIYFDRNDELNEDDVQKILSANTKDEINEILNDIENRIIGNNLDEQDEAIQEFKQEIVSKFNLDEDDCELMTELDAELEDYPVYLSANSNTLVRNTGDVHLTVAIARQDDPKYWEDDYLMLPGMYSDSISDSEENKQNLSDVCAVLGVNKSEMEAAYTKYFSLEEPLKLPAPTIEMGEPQTTAEKFIYDWENNTTDYGVLSFMTRIGLDDYIKNFDRIKADGIVIPAGAYCGLHDPMQGACSLMEIEVKTPITLPMSRIDISVGDEEHNHGYSLEKICGLTEEAWGKREAYADLVRTDAEKELISKMQAISGKNKLPTKPLVSGVFGNVADHLDLSIRVWNDLDARNGLSDKELFDFFVDYTEKGRKSIDGIPDAERQNIIMTAAQAFVEYGSGKIDSEQLYKVGEILTAQVNEVKMRQLAEAAPVGSNLKDAVVAVCKSTLPNTKM